MWPCGKKGCLSRNAGIVTAQRFYLVDEAVSLTFYHVINDVEVWGGYIFTFARCSFVHSPGRSKCAISLSPSTIDLTMDSMVVITISADWGTSWIHASLTWRTLLSEMSSTLIFDWFLYPWLRFWSLFWTSLDVQSNRLTCCWSIIKFLNKILTFNMKEGRVLARVQDVQLFHHSGAWRAVKMQPSNKTESSRQIISFLLQVLQFSAVHNVNQLVCTVPMHVRSSMVIWHP